MTDSHHEYERGLAAMKPLHIRGMHGLGDNLHQRAIVRHLLGEGRAIWLETPWPSVYHDLTGERLHLIDPHSRLRTQAKNAAREATRYSSVPIPQGAEERHIWYRPAEIRRLGSVLAAMVAPLGLATADADFRLPVHGEWQDLAEAWISKWQPDRPLMIYRPLNERKEWSGCRARNPDHAAYAAIFRSIRARFFVVSVADFESGREWQVGEDVDPDIALHHGELSFEALAGLISRSALVFTSPGFAAILAQALGRPSITVFGGYEDSHSFSAGVRFAPTLGIDPIRPCQCFEHDHGCQKRIDLPRALAHAGAFAAAAAQGRAFAA